MVFQEDDDEGSKEPDRCVDISQDEVCDVEGSVDLENEGAGNLR